MIPVLYVDDEPDLLAIGKLFLESTGEFSVTVKASAEEGLEALKEPFFEAVISDFQMPDMDGLTFLKAIRAGGNDIPFIIFTGRSREEVVIEALNAGADFYLQKGGDPRPQFAELSAKIRQAVSRRNAEVALRNAGRDWETTFAATSDGICLLDVSQKIIRCNHTMIEIAGVQTGEDLAGHICWEVMHGTSSHIEQCPAARMMKTLVREREELQLKDRWFDVLADPVLDASGKLTGIVHTMRDITERKHAESELRAAYEQLAAQEEELRGQYDEISELQKKTGQSQAMLQNVLDTVPVRVFWKDTTSGFVGCNNSFAHDAGFASPADLIGKTDYDMVWRSQAAAYQADDRAVMQSGVPKLGYEELQSTPDGTKIWLRTSKVPLRDRHGTITGILGTYEDITERKKAEEAIRESEKRLADIVNFLPDPTFAIDKAGKVIAWNRAIEEMTGIPALTMMGRGDYEYAVPFYGEQRPILIDLVFAPARSVAKKYTHIVRDGSSLSAETALPTPRGKKITVIVKASPLYDRKGEAIGAIEAIRDITERKHAESELHAAYEQLTAQEEELREQYDEIVQREQQVRESEEKFRGVFNNANDEIYIHGTETDGSPGKFLEVNSTMCTMLGYSREELLRMTVKDIVSDEHRKKMAQIKVSFAQSPNVTFFAEHRRKDGSIFPVEVNLHASSLDGKRVAIAVARDITERKRTEQSIELANKKLNLMNDITRHNLLNIMTGLLGSVDMALVTDEKPKRDDILGQIKDLAAQVQEQMEFSVRYEEVGVREPIWLALEEVVDRVRPAFERSGARIATDLAGFEIYADPLFEKVIYTMLDNAVRHGQKVTKVWFSGKVTDNGLVLTCYDDGVGIPHGLKDRIFEKREGQYYGFELFLVREILAITGITIQETGTPGEGARFEMQIPKTGYRSTG